MTNRRRRRRSCDPNAGAGTKAWAELCLFNCTEFFSSRSSLEGVWELLNHDVRESLMRDPARCLLATSCYCWFPMEDLLLINSTTGEIRVRVNFYARSFLSKANFFVTEVYTSFQEGGGDMFFFLSTFRCFWCFCVVLSTDVNTFCLFLLNAVREIVGREGEKRVDEKKDSREECVRAF